MTNFEKDKVLSIVKYYGGLLFGSFILGRLMKKSFETGAVYGIACAGAEVEKIVEKENLNKESE